MNDSSSPWKLALEDIRKTEGHLGTMLSLNNDLYVYIRDEAPDDSEKTIRQIAGNLFSSLRVIRTKDDQGFEEDLDIDLPAFSF